MYVDQKAFSLTNVQLLKNRANTSSLTLNKDSNTIDITLEGWDNLLNSIYVTDLTKAVTCSKVTYWVDNNKTSGKEVTTPSQNQFLYGQAYPTRENGISLTVELFNENNEKLNDGKDIFATDANGQLHLTPSMFGRTSFDDVYVVAHLTNEDYYTQVQNTTRLPSKMVVTADNATYHRNATVHVKITPSTGAPAANGTVSVYYGDIFLGNITVNNNQGVSDAILTNITADKFLEVGMHNLTLKYWGDLYNDAVNITTQINVTKAQSNITFAFSEYGYDLLVNLTIVDDWNDMYYADATGTVLVEVYGSQPVPIQSRTVYLVNGTGIAAFDLLPGNYTIKANYHGDGNYNASVNSTIAELHKKHDIRVLIELNATAGDIMVDETVYINVKILTPEGYTATGNVTLYLDNEKYILPLNATSQASFNKTGLSAGHKIVTVCYDGSVDLQANYGEASFNVLKYNTTFTINVTNITHNQKEIINVTFANETEGAVYIFVNDRNYSAPIHNRTAILELSNLTVGEHNVTVYFPGDWTFNNVTNMTRFYVEKITPEIIINVDNVTYGNPTKIIINVPDCVSGNMSIKIDGTPYGNAKAVENGKVEFDLGNLNAGDYTVEAIYSGDTNHTGTTKEQKFKVYKANRTIQIDVQDIIHGAVEHITVHVNATGDVTIRVNGKSETITLNNGIAELDVYNLTAKTYTVDVTYNGNDNYNKSSASETFTVAKMTTSLDIQVHEVYVRGMEYINITVKNSTGEVAKDLNGTLTLNIDGANRAVKIVNGTATFYSSEFNNVVGKRVVWAFYEGDVNFTASKAMNTYQVITKSLDDKEWNVTAKDIYVGEAGNITVLLPSDVTGFIDIEVEAYPGYGDRDDTYYKKPENGKAVLNPKDLKEGKYHVYVTYIGTDYEESYLDTFFTVSKIPTTLEVSVDSPIIVGNDAIITITMNPNINGTVELTVGDNTYYVAVVNGAGKYVVNNLTNATYNIKAKYAGDYQYSGSTSNTAILMVTNVPTNLSISIDKTSMYVSDKAVVSIELLNQSGNVIPINVVVTVTVNGTNHTVGLVNGRANFTLSGLDNDTYTINAVFAGFDEYVQSVSNTLTLNVTRFIPKVNVTATNRSVDEPVTITVTIPADANGFVVVSGNFTDNEIYIANSEFTGGVAAIDVGGLANGTYSVHIVYYDNDPNVVGVNDTNFTVSKLNTTVRIDVNSTVYDNKVNITVYVDNGVEGTITIKLNNTDLGTFDIVNGNVNITIDNPGAENYTVYAIYNGNYKYNVNNTSKDFTVEKATSVIVIDSATADAATNATVVVRINKTATGNITITVNGTKYNATIENGSATFTINKLLPGSYNITAEYIGDDNNTPVTSVTAVNALAITKISNYIINVTANDTKVGMNTTIIVNVPLDASGNVSIYVDGIPVGNATITSGVAKLNVTQPYGNHTINVTFTDERYAPGNATATYEVFKHDAPLEIQAVSIKVGDVAYINVTAPSDNVTIEINGKPYNRVRYEGGIAYFEVSDLDYGNKTITAIYTGNDYYVSNSTTKQFNVTKAMSFVNVTSVEIIAGADATINITGPLDHDGVAIVNVDGINYNVILTAGKGNLTIKGLLNTTYPVTVTYLENDKYLSSTNTSATIKVFKVASAVTVKFDNITYGKVAIIDVNVTDGASGNVTIKIGNITKTVGLVNGKAQLIVPGLAAKEYDVNVTYNGDYKYLPSNATAKLKVSPATDGSIDVIDLGNSTVIVKVKDNATGNVTIKVGNHTYNATVVNGTAKITLVNETPGTHNITVIYSGDDNHEGKTVNASATIPKLSTPITVDVNNTVVGNVTRIVVTVPANVTNNVTIEIDGVKYNRTANNGVAVFEIHGLTAGNKTVTAIYPSDVWYVSNSTTGQFRVDKLESKVNVTGDEITVGEVAEVNITGPKDYNGTAIVYVDSTTYSVTITNGTGQLKVKGLSNGTHEVKVTLTENSKYKQAVNNSAKIIVSMVVDAKINATVDNITVGDPAIIKVKLPSDATGNVTVKVANITKTVPIAGGENEIIVLGIPVGEHNITVTYNGNDKYLPANTTVKIKVSPIKTTENDVRIIDKGNGTVVITVSGNATGNVTVKVGNNTYNATVVNGTATLNLVNETPGTHNITVVYSGDENHTGITVNGTAYIPKHATPISIDVNNTVVGNVTRIVVTVPANVTNNVTIEIDGVTYNRTANSGVAVFEIPGLTAGNKTVTAVYAGDDWYSANSTTKRFNVGKINSFVNVTSAEINVGQDAVINITAPDDYNGIVVVNVDGINHNVILTAGKGNLTLKGLSNATHPITATYLENDKYLESTNTSATIKVFKVASSVTVKFDNITYGNVAIIDVNVTDGATGNVTIKIGNITKTVGLVNGKAQLVVPGLDAKEYDVNVTYNGDNKYLPSNATSKLKVSPATDGSIDVIDLGNGTVVVKVKDNATGNVTVKVGNNTYNATIVNGTAKITLVNETPGTHNVTVIYSGDDNHEGKTVNASATIPKLSTPITVDVNDTVVGNVTRIVVTVPANVTNNVTIEIDGVKYNRTANSGVAVFEIPGLTAGNKTVTAVYAGDAWYSANSTTGRFKVSKIRSFVNVTSDVIKVGEDAVINITGPSGYDGVAVVNIDGVNHNVILTGGNGQLTVKGLSNATHKINVTYLENDKYMQSVNNSATVKVFKVGGIEINSTVDNITVGDPAIVKVTLPDDATGNVTVTIANITKTVTIAGGDNEIIVTGVPVGEHNVTIRYNGDDKYLPANTTDKIKVSPLVPQGFSVEDLGNGTVVVTVPEGATGNVTVTIGNNTYNATVVNGSAKIDLVNETPGTYDAVVFYSGDETHGNFTVDKAVTIPKYSTPISIDVNDTFVGNVTRIVVSVPENVTENVTIEIDGEQYSAAVNDGKAVFNVTGLASGLKSVTAKYAGDDWYVFNSTTTKFRVNKHQSQVNVTDTEITVGETAVINITAPGDYDGVVIVVVNGTSYSAILTNGSGQVKITGLLNGTYDVEATLIENDKYLSSANISATVKVFKVNDTVISSSADNITVGDPAIIKVTVPDDATGNVTVTIGNITKKVPVAGGENEIIFTGLPVGEHDIAIIYNGDKKYMPANITDNIKVSPVNTTKDDVKVIDQGNGTVIITVPGNATGNMTVKVGNHTYNATVINGTAIINLVNETPGTQNITVIYSGDENHTGVAINATANIPMYPTPISIEVNGTVVGGVAHIIVNVPENVTNNVTIEIDGVKYSRAAENGTAVFDITGLTAGNKTVTATYYGDSWYQSNSTTNQFNVGKVNSTVKATDAVINVGDPAIINITGPGDYNATAIVNVDGINHTVMLTNGIGQIKINNLANGTYTITVTYPENDKYLSSTNDSASIRVFKVESEVTLNAHNITYGEVAVINVNVTPGATGNVTITIGNVTKIIGLANAEAQLIVPKLAAGEYDITVTYNGDYKYLPSNALGKFKVSTSSDDTIDVIDLGNRTVIVNVKGNATGTVTITIGNNTYNATIVNGTATIELVNETPGLHEMTVFYSGDSNHENKTLNRTAYIPKYSTPISIQVNNTIIDNITRVVVTVPENVTRNVTIEIDGIKYSMPVTDGKAVFEIKGLTAGEKTVTAIYNGDDWYLFNSTTDQFRVDKLNSTVNVTSAVIKVGEVAVINITGPWDYNGTASVHINGTAYSVKLTMGVGQLKVTGLKEGTHVIEVTLLENNKYLESNNNSATIAVSKVNNTEISSSVDNITVGNPAFVKVTLPDDATGNVTVTIANITVTVPITGGVNEIPVNGVPVGEHDVKITYNGDDKYKPANTTDKIKVSQVQVTDKDVKINDLGNGTVVITVPGNATGNVTVKIGNNTYNATVVNGTAVVDLVNETPGSYNMTVIYSGDENYTGATANGTVTVPKYVTPISIEVADIEVGDVARIVVTVPKDVKNNVTIEIDGAKYNATASNGKATFDIPGLSAGNKTIVATYFEDEWHQFNSTTNQFEVTRLKSQVNVTSASIKVGETAVINIIGPSDYNGAVMISVDNKVYSAMLTNGVGQINITELANGTYGITATLIENDKYLESTNDSAVILVSKIDGINITSSVDNITVGDPAIVKVTLPDDATGNVTVTIGNITKTVPISGGENEIILLDVPVGEHDVKITYNGDDKYLPANTTDEIKVSPVNMTKDDIKVFDQGNGTVVILVGDNATGNITVKVGDNNYTVPIVNGTAVVDLVNETPGSYNITVIYPGDENHTAVETSAGVTIPKYETPIYIEVADIYVGDKALINVTLPVKAAGNVTIEIDGKTYTPDSFADGVARFTVENLIAGAKTVVAIYSGDNNYLNNHTTANFTVYKYDAPISVKVNDVDAGEAATVEVTLPDDATGYVIVNVNGTEYGINLTNGQKSVDVPVIKSGTYDVVVTYLGDHKYLSNTTSTTFKADKVSGNTTIEVQNSTVGGDVIVKVTVPTDATGNVTIVIDNTTYVVNVTGGENTIPIPGVGEGTHNINVTYSGDDKYKPVSYVTNVTVFKSIVAGPIKRGWNSPYDYKAEFLNKDGTPLVNANVQFIINGKTYNVKTDGEGIGYVTDSHLPVGVYDVTVINPVTGEQVTSTITIVKRLLENKDITMDFVDGTYYVVRAIGDDGEPVGAGEFVDIYANTIHYSCRTDKDGYARLLINLNPKKYVLRAEYKNTEVVNNLVVKQTLKLVKKTVKVKKGKKLKLKAKLKWSNGKPIKGKKIVFKFKGKKYKAKTNSKGIAKVTIKKKITKKLKKGKKYKYSATYRTNMVKGKVKVKK